MHDASFYQSLPSRTQSLKEMLREPGSFQSIPPTWEVIVTDIQGSTKAVMEGRYRDVNTVAASCVIACLNVAKKHPGVQIPFSYGGDGATLLIPVSLLPEMREALRILQGNTLATQKLVLRVGSISVQKIVEAGKKLTIAKLSIAPGYDQAVFLGDGLAYADQVIKADMTTSDIQEAESKEVDLSGLLCRWNEIKPKQAQEEVVCAIIQARDQGRQAAIYAEVLELLDRVYGPYQERHPVTAKALTPSIRLKNLRKKSQLMTGRVKFLLLLPEFIRACGTSLLFHFALRLGGFDPARYVPQLIAATDTLHLSGTLYTIVLGTEAQRLAFRSGLDRLEQSGQLLYGTSSSPASVMTCYVQKYEAGHIHFLDGAGGGYTQASKEFKQKLKASAS
jgi:hypothetical protein